VRAHAPDVDRGAVGYQESDYLLVEIIRDYNTGIAESLSIKAFAHLEAQVAEVTAVYPDSDAFSCTLKFLSDDNGIRDTRAESVVGIDQESAGIGI